MAIKVVLSVLFPLIFVIHCRSTVGWSQPVVCIHSNSVASEDKENCTWPEVFPSIQAVATFFVPKRQDVRISFGQSSAGVGLGLHFGFAVEACRGWVGRNVVGTHRSASMQYGNPTGLGFKVAGNPPVWGRSRAGALPSC